MALKVWLKLEARLTVGQGAPGVSRFIPTCVFKRFDQIQLAAFKAVLQVIAPRADRADHR